MTGQRPVTTAQCSYIGNECHKSYLPDFTQCKMNNLMFLRAYRVSIKKSKSKSLTGIVAIIIIIVIFLRHSLNNTRNTHESEQKKTFRKYDTLCIDSAQYSIELHEIISLNGYRPLKLNQFEMVRQYFFWCFEGRKENELWKNHYDEFIASCVCLCVLLLLFVLVIMQMLLK